MSKKILAKNLFILLFVLSFVFGNALTALASSSKGIMINVVYDDSTSMVVDYDANEKPIMRWSQAKYAMEVFCAMMGKNDVMNIYPMSQVGDLWRTVYGNEADRVQTIHEMNSYYGGTPFETVTEAVKDLKNADDSYEKWLVIITDGAFDNGKTSPEYVQSKLDDYNKDGIKTVYLGIGDKAPTMQSNPAMGGYAEKATDGTEVLKKVTNVANQIFEHLVLPTGFIKTNGTVNTLSFDIPVNQIVVFAQGDAVSVGVMNYNGREIQPTSVEEVKYSDVKPKNYGGALVDTSLKGVVVTFDTNGDPFPSGDYSISVANAKTVEFYYNPGVVVNSGLRYDGRLVQSEDKLYAGEYEAEMSFINPLTNETVQSELLASVDFALHIENNGKIQTMSAQKGTVHLEEGNVTISAVAQLPGAVELRNDREYTVYPEPIKLELGFVFGKQSYTQDELGQDAVPVILTAVNTVNGESITEAEWHAASVNVTEAGGIRWNVERADQVGSWNLTPISADGSVFSVSVGNTGFSAEVTFDHEGQYAFGAADFSLQVDAYAGNLLQFEVNMPVEHYKVADLMEVPDEERMTVTVYAEDPVTGEFEPLSEELWNVMELTVSSDKRITFEVERGDETGIWYVKPAPYMNDRLMTDYGSIEMEIKAAAELGELRYAGTGRDYVKLEQMSKSEWIPLVLPRLIAIALLLWFVIGHLSKKRIPPMRKLNPRCRYRGVESAKRGIKKEWFSVIWPNGPERARVFCSNGDFKCDFDDLRIVAAGKRSFRIINKRLPLDRIKICGQFYKDMDEVHKERFSYSTFDITSTNPSENNRSMGTFTFM